MVDWLIPGAALLAGLAGSAHCLAMCGGIMGALSLGAVGSRGQRLLLVITMNLGKALSYGAAGALAGGLGAVIDKELAALQLGQALRWASAAILVAIGLRLLLGIQLLGPIERAGVRIWRRLQPAWQRVLPIDGPAKALGAGLLWGWLPCGLVYSQLALAVTTGSAVIGALTLLAFGLGTALSLTGLAAALNFLGIKGLPARATGVLLIVFGVWIAMPWAGTAGERDGHPHTEATLRVVVDATAGVA